MQHSSESPPHRSNGLPPLLRLIRPKQWIKNGFVLAPLIFSGQFLNHEALLNAVAAFFLFCLASSAAYVVNDIQDMEKDRKHPVKSRSRPLASGEVRVQGALLMLLFLYGILAAGLFLYPRITGVLLGYLALNFAYSRFLKHEPVIDIFTIAIGFVLRVYAGAMALEVPVSSWMFITTLCLALYLAAIKRRQEIELSGPEGRKVLEKYSGPLVERYAEMAATGALIFYSLFVMASRPELVITIPLVLYGLFRYWYVVESQDGGESPTDALLSDWQLLMTVVAWVVFCAYALWPQ